MSNTPRRRTGRDPREQLFEYTKKGVELNTKAIFTGPDGTETAGIVRKIYIKPYETEQHVFFEYTSEDGDTTIIEDIPSKFVTYPVIDKKKLKENAFNTNWGKNTSLNLNPENLIWKQSEGNKKSEQSLKAFLKSPLRGVSRKKKSRKSSRKPRRKSSKKPRRKSSKKTRSKSKK